MPEGPRNHLEQIAEIHLLGVHRDGARLDLRQIENVADQIQQVGARAVNGARELHLLAGQVAVGIVGELLAQDEDAVQGRAQLVRHVGQELGLVFRRERELGGLLLDRAARLLDFLVLRLHLDVAVRELLRLLLELLVRLLQLALLSLQLGGELLRLFEQPLGLHGRLDGVQDDTDGRRELVEESELQIGESAEGGELDHRLHLALELHRQHDDVPRLCLEQSRSDRHHVVRHLGDENAPCVECALADETLAELEAVGMAAFGAVRIGGEQLQRVLPIVGLDLIDDAMLRLDQRRELGKHEAADGHQIALALQHVGEAREVGLQPVLLGVLIGGEAQIADHGVDVVFELGDLAARFHLHRAGKVALGDRGRHFGDGAHLRRQVGGEQVHVAGQVLPSARRARHVGLAAEPPFDAHFAGHGGHLVGKGRERVRHVVDGLGERRHLALGGDGEILLQVAVRDRGHHLDDAAHLLGQVRRHDVDGVGQILPGSGDARHLRLAAETPFGAHLARDARHLARESVQLVDHGVDGVLQLENLALHVHRDLARQVAARHRGGHLGDVSHLRGQVGREQVHVVGQVLPGTGDTGHHSLSAEASVGAHFARDARHLAGERAQLIDHRVERFLEEQDFAAHVHGDLARQVAGRDGGGHLGDVAHLRGQVAGHRVDVIGQILPGARDARHLGLAAELALGAHLARDARHFARESVQLVDHGVDGVLQLENLALRHPP